ncbi:MAG: hypothetical protein H0V17_06185, partial [Deltaproteobacteria bacterium]|nr:hypothetical protein [Deltaproteobacteria bacterium]
MRIGIASVLAAVLWSGTVGAQPKPEGGMASFEKDLDALFVTGGLTADGAA